MAGFSRDRVRTGTWGFTLTGAAVGGTTSARPKVTITY